MPVKKTILKKPSAGPAASKKALFQRGKVDRKVVHEATKMTKEQWDKHQEGMAEKWPLPDYMKGQKGHTQYKDETYVYVTRWTADTLIAYRPHAKAPGSKSHLRYESYSKAKTVGEALRLGSYPQDWCWDYERGFLRVLGGQMRDEPLDIAKGEESNITDVDLAINTWYTRELAKKLGMKTSELSESVGWGESLHIRALRLLAQQEARERLEAADREGRRVTDEEMLLTLKRWPFYRNPWRKNVMQAGKTWVFSDTLGLLRDRQGDVHLTAATRRYPQVVELFSRWLTDRLPEETKQFTFSSINVNCNYAAAPHRDNGNLGPSFISAFGEFSGGALNYWPEDTGGDLAKVMKNKGASFDLQKGLALFNGNCAHAVDSFSGSRYSLVYFTIQCHASARPEDRVKLGSLGIPLPKADVDPFAIIRPPRGYASAGTVATPCRGAKGELPPFRFFERSALEKQPCRRKPKSQAEVKKIAEKRLQPENAKSFYRTEQRRELKYGDAEMEI